MNAVLFSLVLAAAPVLPEAQNVGPDGAQLTSHDHQVLARGGVLTHMREIDGTPVKEATAMALIDFPPDVVFGVISKYEEQPEYMPYVKSSRLEERTKTEAKVHFELSFPWPIGKRTYGLHFKESDVVYDDVVVHTSHYTYLPDSGNINDTYGTWEVIPYGEGSLVRFVCFTDPGIKLPKWARNMVTDAATPMVMKKLRKRVEELQERASSPGG